MSKQIQMYADGDKLTVKVLLNSVTKGVTNKGAPYLSLVFQDGSGTIDAKYWNVDKEALDAFKPGMLVEVNGDVLCHNHQLQFRVQNMREISQEGIDLRDYVKASELSENQLKFEIMKYVSDIQDETISKLIREMLKQREEKFFVYPAAQKNHHDFVGGLATHVLGMLNLADTLAKSYPLLNRDLLIGGVILHDLGKLDELSGAIVTEYTMEGRLLGHISLMQAEISDTAKRLGLEGEAVTLLRHMVLSHHGVYEYGSPVLPMIPEAEMLYLIDNIDARMNTLKKALEPVEPGNFTPRIFAMENRAFYKHK